MKYISLTSRLSSNNHRRVFALLLMVAISLALMPAPRPTWATDQMSFKASAASINLDAPNSPGKTDVPFNGSYATKISPPDLSTFPNLYMEISLIGRASHMGNITGTINQNASYIYFDPGIQRWSGTISGTTFFVASNGDRLDATFTGSFTQDSSGQVTFDGHYTFDGGTGRFREATGSADTTIGLADVNVGIGYVEFSGTISY